MFLNWTAMNKYRKRFPFKKFVDCLFTTYFICLGLVLMFDFAEGKVGLPIIKKYSFQISPWLQVKKLED